MEEQNWKQKYLDALDQLESREKAWQQTESLLHQGLSRVALAAQGLDGQLDRDLSQLRNVIRGQTDPAQLAEVIDDLSRSVTRLDELRSGKAKTNTPQELLIHWLDSLSVPSDLKARIKQLRRRFAETSEVAEMEAPLRELAELMNTCLQQEGKGAASPAGSGSFLQRLFGGGESPTADTTIRNEPPAPQLGEFCIQLLDTLSLPAELTTQVNHLKDKLAEGFSDHAVAPALTAIADIISAMRQQMENENRELQDFLRQLTEHLQDIDQHLAGAQSESRAARDSGRRLDAEVNAHVRHIESTVEGTREPGQLKQLVQARLDAIRAHLSEYRRAEEQQQEALEARLEQLNSRIHTMESEGEQLRQRLKEKHEQAVRDPLTGLSNRLAYDERIIQEYARWKRYQQPLVLMVIDIDHFKRINDDYGHKAGDKALILIAEQLQKNLRESDFLARFGGEEFVVLMPETDLDAALVAANKLREAVAGCQFHYQGANVRITISAGLAQLREDDSSESLFQRADQAMYGAKSAGRNRCQTEAG
jgi:diguanylate cyclase